MLSFLTDENISPMVAIQVKLKQPDIVIYNIFDWREGKYLKTDDRIILEAALEENLTLVTYDQNSIPERLSQMAADNQQHSGVLFIDKKSIAQHDIGGQAGAIIRYWQKMNSLDWMNVVNYLHPAL